MATTQQTRPKHSVGKKIRQVLLATTFVASGLFVDGNAIAAPAPAGQIIQNKATGYFLDTASVQQPIFSNTVQITVAEIAGISIVASGTSGTVTAGSTVSFLFTITNDGNDPTQFFIPGGPSAFSGGTVSSIRVTEYDPDGPGPTAPTILPLITVPASGAVTGALPSANAFNNGSIPAGGSITVRVSLTAAVTGGAMSVTLGDTPAAPNNQNQDYSTTTSGLKDLYTQDNSLLTNGDLVSGDPINGDATNHRKEASAINSIAGLPTISGTVFEDPNYGGGLGRPLSTAGASPQQSATVELYNSAGAYLSSTTTNALGQYTFTGVTAGNYYVRVVNSTVRSSRPGYVISASAPLIPVQTFRINASSGTPTNVLNRVGGEAPSAVDTGSATTGAVLNTTNFTFTTGAGTAAATAQAQSVTPVTVSSSSVAGIDFGFNFDTIVNINPSRQGSLRQFVTNSNALANSTLNQEANPNPAPGTTAIDPPAGVETTIFMIPANALTSGIARISVSVAAPPSNTLTITDSFTAIDGRTQTINQGDTNSSILGDTTTPIGIGGNLLTGVAAPEIELLMTTSNAFTVNGQNTLIHSIAVTGNGTSAILTNPTASNSRIENIVTGTLSAALNQPGGTLSKSLLINSSNTVITRNLLRATSEPIIINSNNVVGLTNITITDNEVTTGRLGDVAATSACIQFANAPNIKSAANTLIQNNYLNKCAWGIMMQGDSTGVNATILKNTINQSATAGILINSGEHNHLIQENAIYNSLEAGIVVENGPTGIKITKNSIYANADVGIDLSPNSASRATEGLTPNNGSIDNASAATPYGNNGIDYPVIKSSILNSGTLTVKGFVGATAAGNPDFANAELEFFIADNTPANQDGEIIAGDGKNLPHGEGRTYIGTCTADSNGLFGITTPCSFSNAGTLGLIDPKAITATARDAAGNTSEFSSIPTSNANVLMVKRITAINGDRIKNPNDNTPLNLFIDDSTARDNHANWPTPPSTTPNVSSFLRGVIDAGKVLPGDTIEYTIYFLNAEDGNATGVKICDRITGSQTLLTDAYGTPGSGKDIQLHQGDGLFSNNWSSLATSDLTSAADTGDRVQLMDTSIVPSSCHLDMITGGATDTGTLVVDVTGTGNTPNQPDWSPLVGATGPGTANSYGFIRFTTKVNP